MSIPGNMEKITRIDYVMHKGAIIAPTAFETTIKRASKHGHTIKEEILLHCCPSEFGIECPEACLQVYDTCMDCWSQYIIQTEEGSKAK